TAAGATPEGGWPAAVPPWPGPSPRPSRAHGAHEGLGGQPSQGAGGAEGSTPPKEISKLFWAGQEETSFF
ncbi:hypothetical protein TIFTF001_056509, partial [Ficus carica]